eukprot:1943867-Prymnesium_polylepis.1
MPSCSCSEDGVRAWRPKWRRRATLRTGEVMDFTMHELSDGVGVASGPPCSAVRLIDSPRRVYRVPARLYVKSMSVRP